MSVGPLEIDTLPAVPLHALNPVHSTTPYSSASSTRSRHSNDMVRSASYTNLPGLSTLSSSQPEPLKRTFSDNVLSTLAQQPARITSSMQNANVELFRRASFKTKKRMSHARFVSPTDLEVVEREDKSGRDSDTQSTRSSRSLGTSLRGLAKRSWIPGSGSRSSSPDKAQLEKKRSLSPKKRTSFFSATITVPEPAATRTSPRSSHQEDEHRSRHDDEQTPKVIEPSLLPPSRPGSDTSTFDPDSDTSSKILSRRSSRTSVRSVNSADRSYLSVRNMKVPPVPSISPERHAQLYGDKSTQRDPMWSQFRAADGEHSSFAVKTGLQKAKTIRTFLLPFLAKSADFHPTELLRPEDLDRRVSILNRWWTSLLDLLNGAHQQSVSSTDRPAFLEAISEIMMRREWRVNHVPSDADSSNAESITAVSESNISADADDSSSLMSTVHQNIQTIFVQNLLTQMTFVVDKLSMRTAPASLVAFGGKTCAYAFVYCPGVADILCRLWHFPLGTTKRIFAEFGVNDSLKAGLLSKELGASFPAALRSLCFTSDTSLARHVQYKGQLPPGSGAIRWYGPWVNRWSGRDSDLFFVFVKYFHFLVAEMLPRKLSAAERASIPGLVPVHCQILLVLQSTLYRQAGHFAAYISSPAAISDNPDAMAPVPMIINNATRSINENRLVMLLRDLAGERDAENDDLADLLISSFQYVLKAATRKISMYNNDACFILCDFLEELMPIIAKFKRSHDESEDWSFWLTVFKSMLASHTTMTQIRVLAFLYSMWPILAPNEERKQDLVLDWLLTPDFFNDYFCHWSPMVRHYYYRLLCWRIARCDGPASDIDLRTFQTLRDRLNLAWAHHQYMSADAEMRGIVPPSASPCSPAPGRQLMILRTDSAPHGGNFNSFDKLSLTNNSGPYGAASSPNRLPEADLQQSFLKKRWSLLKTINLFSGPANSRPGEVTPPRSPDAVRPNSKSRQLGASEPLSRPTTPPHQALSFKFSLEYTNTRPSLPAKTKRLPNPLLPPNAQKLLDELGVLEKLGSEDKLIRPEIKPQKPLPHELTGARYSGRALSEWAQVIAECRNFYTRRKQEGCPKDSLVETPCMAVESFRMFG